MSACQIRLCSLMLRDDFGETVEKVCILLLQMGYTPSGIIAQHTGLGLREVKRALAALIQHNLVTFGYNKKGFVEYVGSVEAILSRCRFPWYVYATRTLYGDAAELVIEELLRHGQQQLSVVVHRVHERLTEALQDSATPALSIYDIRDKFVNLTQTQFIQRCPTLGNPDDAKTTAIPVFRDETEEELYVVPTVDLNEVGMKRKRSTEDSEQPQKKSKISNDASDAGIYWRVNYERFDRHLRDQTLIQAVTNKIDARGGEILRSMLRLCEVSSDTRAPSTNPISCNEIFQALPKELGLSRQLVDQYLKILVEDSTDFVQKMGDSGGGMFRICFQKCFTTLCQTHIQSVVQERFGSKSLRIFRLLVTKKQLEQKQIEEFAMVPAKEAKELLYTMFGEHFLTLTEIPRTPDHAPSRTFFVFSVNTNQVARLLLERCYKARYNLIVKRNQELSEHKRLLEKHQRMEAIMSSLEQSGADNAQKQEIEEMMTPVERNLVTKVKNNAKQIEMAELQMDDTMFVLSTYLHYSHLR